MSASSNQGNHEDPVRRRPRKASSRSTQAAAIGKIKTENKNPVWKVREWLYEWLGRAWENPRPLLIYTLGSLLILFAITQVLALNVEEGFSIYCLVRPCRIPSSSTNDQTSQVGNENTTLSLLEKRGLERLVNSAKSSAGDIKQSFLTEGERFGLYEEEPLCLKTALTYPQGTQIQRDPQRNPRLHQVSRLPWRHTSRV
jgi:hypothetical protein